MPHHKLKMRQCNSSLDLKSLTRTLIERASSFKVKARAEKLKEMAANPKQILLDAMAKLDAKRATRVQSRPPSSISVSSDAVVTTHVF